MRNILTILFTIWSLYLHAQIIPNASFEEFNDGLPSSWIIRGDTSLLTIDSSSAFHGDYCLSINDQSDSTYVSLETPFIEITPGDSFETRARVLFYSGVNQNQNLGITLGLRFYSADSVYTHGIFHSDWDLDKWHNNDLQLKSGTNSKYASIIITTGGYPSSWNYPDDSNYTKGLVDLVELEHFEFANIYNIKPEIPTIFPNPTFRSVTVKFQKPGAVNLLVYNAIGELIEIIDRFNEQGIPIDLPLSGIYHIIAKSKGEIVMKKKVIRY
ncbi:MAG: hypothetical protein COA58_03925 [Bacteroidetes bacterium]|nr:MAG: hypothetical protein COA58_03925 [Bacteroidota bacterium]